jgi:hypothetical protein
MSGAHRVTAFASCRVEVLMKCLRSFSAAFLIATATAACDESIAPIETCAPEVVCVLGTVRFLDLEGGFWAVRGDDEITYDPLNGMPAAFRSDGLRVYLVARERRDLGGIHMAGPIVEILSIRTIP